MRVKGKFKKKVGYRLAWLGLLTLAAFFLSSTQEEIINYSVGPAIVESIQPAFELVEQSTITQSQAFPISSSRPSDVDATQAPIIKLKAVFVRTGIVVKKDRESLELDSPKLKGVGQERLQVVVPPETPIIEVRIPQVLVNEPNATVTGRPETIERRVVTMNQISIGQLVSVIAGEDISTKTEFTATRIEYSKVISS